MNNYCLRRLRYALNFNDKIMLQIFKFAGYQLSNEELKGYLFKESDAGYVELPDYLLIIFLDGLIIKNRGQKDGENVPTQQERVALSKKQKLTNNLILNKVKIALSLKTEDLIGVLALADFRISKPEISALFRKPDHRNYRECGNQLIRNFLTGLTLEFHAKNSDKTIKVSDSNSSQKKKSS